MKNKLKKVLSCAAVLALSASYNFSSLKAYYDELSGYSFVQDNFDQKLKEENLKAAESEEEYHKMLGQENRSENNFDQDSNKKEAEELRLHAVSSLLLDAENNRVLYEENGYDEIPMASTTKIMTCIVTLENANLSDIVTVSSYAARMPDVQLNIRAGEQYYLKDLLYSLMLESHNDTAVAIAEHVGGSVEGFATMMNDKARTLGCDHTNFVTPNGLDAEGHYTSARDLAVIASYAIKNEQFLKITNASSHQFKEINNKRSCSVSNKNRFLYMMDGAIGVKTGFTNGAGYCFVGALKRPDRTLISVVLGCGWPPNKSLKWKDTTELMTYGLESFEKKQIFEDIDLEPVPVKKGKQNYEALQLDGDLSLLMRGDEKVQVKYEIPKIINAPVEAKAVIGYAKYYINNQFYDAIPIYAEETIDKIDYPFCLNKILHIWSAQY